MIVYKCDRCQNTTEVKSGFPEDWFIIKVYSKPLKKTKGGTSKGYHFCSKCLIEVFGK